MQVSENTNDDFLFIDDSEEDEILDSAIRDTWKVLIVDDDPEIHSVTQLALSDLVVLGRHLEYLHAYSGQDACKLIVEHDDIVLVLLDVVMESDDAGLTVVKYIREELKRDDIRIVLRTGQPGYAPEESVIKDYDINDYKTKTELTRRKLVTTVYAAIRSYQQIDSVTKNRKGLEKIICAAANLLEQHTVHDYTQGVLTEFKKLVDSTTSIFCARGQGIVEGADDLSLYILGQEGLAESKLNQKLIALDNRDTASQITSCFQQKQHFFNASSTSFYFASGGFRAVIHLELEQALTTIEMQLIEVFLTNIATGYENVHLFQKLRNAAYKDWLTELPNRLDFVNLLDDLKAYETSSIDINTWKQTCYDAMNDDFNSPILIAHLFEAAKYINQIKEGTETLNTEDLALLKETVNAFVFDVLGLENTAKNDSGSDKLSGAVDVLIKLRQEARVNKDFALSDKIRDELLEVGIQLKDSRDGTTFTTN